MPGISLLGDSRNAARNRPTSLPAEARSLSRILRLLASPEVASQALLESLAAGIASSSFDKARSTTTSNVCIHSALTRVQEEVQRFVDEMTVAGWNTMADRYAEFCLALAVESVLQDASAFSPPTAMTKEKQGHEARLRDPRQQPRRIMAHAQPPSPSTASASSLSTASSLPVQNHQQQPRTASTTGNSQTSVSMGKDCQHKSSTKSKTVAVVSDASSMEAETSRDSEEDSVSRTSTACTRENSQRAVETMDATNSIHNNDDDDTALGRAMAVKHVWASLLESLHLQVASRTTRVWGRKKIYEVFQFARPVLTSSVPRNVTAAIQLQQRLESECQTVLSTFDTSEPAKHVRVYTTVRSVQQNSKDEHMTVLYIQINLGKILDLQDERNRAVSGEKKKKAGTEFVAVLVPGSPLWTLTASRAPSRSRYTPHILTALENILTETTNVVAAYHVTTPKTTNGMRLEGTEMGVQRFGDLSGTEPMELLRSARSVATGEAVGRFAHMAAIDRSNPVEDLHQAATDNLLRPKKGERNDAETTRLVVGASHPGNDAVAAVAAQVVAESQGTAAVVAATKSGAIVLVDHSLQQKQSRKRARQEALGREQDCPQLQRVCWKWTGETRAAAACWLEDDVAKTNDHDLLQDLPTTEFKCSIVMKGENVYQGLQALVDAGIAQAPLPDFLRDAPSLGGTIRVAHGTFACTDAAFEAV